MEVKRSHSQTAADKEEALDRFPQHCEGLARELGQVIVGQQEVVRHVLTALFVGGHCLLQGVPGLAKTLLVRTLARALDLSFKRIQFTPDLMPMDILGADVLEEDRATGRREIRFMRGPIFANILLADEINRTPPKTQAALLEAMEEHQVTVGGQSYDLPEPFFVLATQNPIEQEGTYLLPEAQLDRFLFLVRMDYPDEKEERQILLRTTAGSQPSVSTVERDSAVQYARVEWLASRSNWTDRGLSSGSNNSTACLRPSSMTRTSSGRTSVMGSPRESRNITVRSTRSG